MNTKITKALEACLNKVTKHGFRVDETASGDILVSWSCSLCSRGARRNEMVLGLLDEVLAPFGLALQPIPGMEEELCLSVQSCTKAIAA